MYLIFDAILVLIMMLIIINATRRGFISAVFKFLTAVVSLGVAICFYRALGAFLDAHVVHAWLAAHGESSFAKLSVPDFTKIFENNEFLAGIAQRFGVDLRGSAFSGLVSSQAGAFAEETANALSLVISNLIAFVLIFIASVLVLKLACLLLSAVCKLPVLRSVNRLLGFLFGLSEALIIGIVLSTACVGIFESYGVIQPDFPLADIGKSTYIIRFLAGLVKTSGAV